MTRYETKQLFAASKDGTRVPFFVTARKGCRSTAANPTMLYGYGGFSVSTTRRPIGPTCRHGSSRAASG